VRIWHLGFIRFTDPKIRAQMAGLLKEAELLDGKALDYSESAIDKQSVY